MLTTMTNRALVLICIAQTTNALYLSGTLADTDLDARASIHRETTPGDIDACKAQCAVDGYCCTRHSGCQWASCVVGCEVASTASSQGGCEATCSSYQGTCYATPPGFPAANFCKSGKCGSSSSCTNLFSNQNCGPSSACHHGCDIFFSQATTPAPTPVPTPAPTAVQAAAVGDPHLQNMFGERFDLAKPGKSILVSIPRGTPVEDALLVVQADARQLGARCSDMYFQEINITGKWTKADLRYTAQVVNDETPQWSKFGPVELKVAHGHTEKGVTYLNLYVRHLGLAGAAVGGLLGEDDHTEAAAPSAACRKTMSLAKHATRSTSELQDASVAFAAAL